MKSILLFLPALIMMLMLSSCKKSNPVGTSPDRQIWPFESGNSWVYLDSLFDTTGAIQNAFDQTIAVSTDSVVAGETWDHLPPGKTIADIEDVIPHDGRNDPNRRGGMKYHSCLFGHGESHIGSFKVEPPFKNALYERTTTNA